MKSKKILTILLSLAIMFTFMPAMAFATNGTGTQGVKSWGANYASVKDNTDDEVDFVTTRTFNNATGYTVAVGQNGSNSAVQGEKKNAPSSAAYFYDLTDSYFASGNTKLDGSTWTSDQFKTSIYSSGILSGVIVQQAYDYEYDTTYNTEAKTYNASKVKNHPVTFTRSSSDKNIWTATLGTWTLTAKMKGYDPAEKGEQTVTFEMSAPVTSSAVTAESVTDPATPDLIGTIAKATVTVKAATPTTATANYYLDTVGSDFTAAGADTSNNATLIKGLYDGAAHTLVADAVEGWTPEYAVYNKSTGRYDTGAATITDVQDEDVLVKVTWKKSGKGDVVKYVKMNLAPAVNFWGFGFTVNKEENNTYSANYDVVGTDYNAADYFGIAVTPNAKNDDAKKLAGKAATKAAVAANQTELMNFFNDFYDIEAKVAKGSVTPVTLSVSPKTLGTTTSAATKAKAALVEKYATLMANFGIAKDFDPANASFLNVVTGETATKATLNLNSELIDEEVEFTSAPSSKTYKGSKTTKKGKLKKNQSFTVKAVSNKGRAISYKLINANSKIKINKTSGKITLKKGLAKGTYKIKVKAYVAGSSSANNKGAEETQAITIKIKK